MGTELNSELAKAMKVGCPARGLRQPGNASSAAAKAGIKAGDVITSLNGKAGTRRCACVGTMPIGSKVGAWSAGCDGNQTVTVEPQQSNQTQS